MENGDSFSECVKPNEKFQMVCAACGSKDVSADAYAQWNEDTQTWEVSSLFDKGAYCGKCDGETRIEKIPIKE